MKNRNRPLTALTLAACVSFPALLKAQQHDQLTASPRLTAEKDQERSEKYGQRELAALETNLESQGIKTSRDGIQEYLRQVTDSKQDWSTARNLIRQLGSDRFSEREAAQQSLMMLPVCPLDPLREATRSSDPEIAFRAKAVLQYAIPRQSQTVNQVIQGIELLQLSGLTKEIFLAVSKFQDEEQIVRSAKKTVLAVVTPGDATFLSSQMTRKTVAPLREISICALRQLENETLADQFEMWSRNPEFSEFTRLESALALADLGDRRSLELLMELMVEGATNTVRARSKVALRKLTGQDFKYTAYDKAEIRAKQAERWQEWITQMGMTAKLRFPLRTVPSSQSAWNEHTLVSLCGVGPTTNKVILYDEAMQEVWSYDSKYPTSAEKMENGNILIAEYHGRRVIEVNPRREIVREYAVRMANSAQPLENGNILLATGGANTVLEIDSEGNTVWELQGNGSFEDAVRLESGNTLIAEGNRNGYDLYEVDPDGERVWEIALPSSVYGGLDAIQPLENGNVLLSLVRGDAVEVDRDTCSVVWQSDDIDARDTFRLDNGNYLVLTKSELLEVDHEGKRVWSKEIDTTSGSIRR